jgi:hypothetical protein
MVAQVAVAAAATPINRQDWGHQAKEAMEVLAGALRVRLLAAAGVALGQLDKTEQL